MKDHITLSFEDGSVQVDYAVSSKNSILLALVTLEAMAVKEVGLSIDDIRAIIDSEKNKLEATPVVD